MVNKTEMYMKIKLHIVGIYKVNDNLNSTYLIFRSNKYIFGKKNFLTAFYKKLQSYIRNFKSNI